MITDGQIQFCKENLSDLSEFIERSETAVFRHYNKLHNHRMEEDYLGNVP